MTITFGTAAHSQAETGQGGAVVRTVLDASGLAGRLVRQLVTVPPGAAHAGTTGPAGELWFMISGAGQLELRGADGAGPVPVSRYQGVRVPAGAGYELRATGQEPAELDVVALPGEAAPGTGGRLVSDLAGCEVETTGDRRFRVVFGPGRGCTEATQFVGEIPPGRAPEHSHAYDEVVLILAGTGVVHGDGVPRPLAPGSCIHLPPGQPHCLENTGQDTLVVLGVFHPGGSPAAKQAAGAP
jgi:mannose-6-phosphate isomerase-like protein (cupin superfamily)